MDSSFLNSDQNGELFDVMEFFKAKVLNSLNDENLFRIANFENDY